MNEDVETLAAEFDALVDLIAGPDPLLIAEDIMRSDWLHAHDARIAAQARADAAEKALAPVLALADKWDEQLRDDLNLPGDEWHHWHSTQLRRAAVASHQEATERNEGMSDAADQS